MRLLFAAVPALGHLLPLAPFIHAAREAGHDVAVLTSAGMAPAMELELPGVTLLPAGPMPPELFAEVARRVPGSDPAAAPEPAAVAEFFAGVRVDLSADTAIEEATRWQPDAIIADAVDFVGPLVATALAIPHALVAFGPALPPEFTTPLFSVVASRYADRGLALVPPAAMFDPAPSLLQPDGWVPPEFVIPFQPAPHQREDSAAANLFASAGERIPVLLTLGTVFGNDTLLGALVSNLESEQTDVVATVMEKAEQHHNTDHVRYEAFRPLAELLPGASVVVSAGGAGTVLAALSQGIPLVVIPQGADQFINAERAAAAGAAKVISDPADTLDAVLEVTADAQYAAAAAAIRDQMRGRQTPRQAIETFLAQVAAAASQ
ncbi:MULTISPECIES: glycosyltransferase [unclassified Curtobacterium]|uniref:glycosyltransferase n=1 Tax=unclassified Curtobacterium TaxID=257496 RepID=UPI000DA972A3|nr:MULTISPECIES: glycosyltransferase [unclassified Curtobacterium]PZE86869.1 glycosyltransferase [Curtobacterium sp. MCBD17_032]